MSMISIQAFASETMLILSRDAYTIIFAIYIVACIEYVNVFFKHGQVREEVNFLMVNF